MEPPSRNDPLLDFDLEDFWSTFPDTPTVPPILAASNDSVRYDNISYDRFFPTQPCHLPTHSNPADEERPMIEHYFSPDDTKRCFFNWIGPDLLSPLTHTDDIFLHLSSFQPSDPVDWIDVRLSILNSGTEELVAEYPFFLPRIETMLGNLPRIREQIHGIITKYHHAKGSENVRFRLNLWPRKETILKHVMGTTIPLSSAHAVKSVSPLDPGAFVQNIVGNFDDGSPWKGTLYI
ncbi:hypothetical protein NUU61_001439 [Penicillium alfredii]|uniref:Uncharacterized protein n=1 Tax=Penicillium alfredii TaxID=1506179 RepID=A0A9W9KM34_9EURO|nr:uncharacterized protein NUU61_001439 [Penicillium alfredii]KAJ5111809.1 hypothetical protein NUU61_001439 [Penicillium alfredii]